jgi:ABC-type nitrate/sulfonate/bicarbonate transport system substrate-binding protein
MQTTIVSSARNADAIWYSRSSVPTVLGVAAQRGMLQQEFAVDGLALLSVQDYANDAPRDAHIDHQLTRCLRQGGSVPALWARAEGADTRLIGLSWTDEFQVVLALPDSGIRTARDLRGRRLGLPLRPYEKVDSRIARFPRRARIGRTELSRY